MSIHIVFCSYVCSAVQFIYFPLVLSLATMVYVKCGKCFKMSTLTCGFCNHVNKEDRRGVKRTKLQAEEMSDDKKATTDEERSGVPPPGTPPQTEMLESQIAGLKKHVQALQRSLNFEQDAKELAQKALGRSDAMCQRLKKERMEVGKQHTAAMTTVIEEMATVKGENATLQRWLNKNIEDTKEAKQRAQNKGKGDKGKGDNGHN